MTLTHVQALDRERKALNARRITRVAFIASVGLVLLTLLADFPAVIIGLTLLSSTVLGFADFATRKRPILGAQIVIAMTFVASIGAVVATRWLGSSPFYLVLVMLIALATLPVRGVLITSGVAVITLPVMTLFTAGIPQPSLSTLELMPNAATVVVITAVVAVLQARTWSHLIERAAGLEDERRQAEDRYQLIANNTRDFLLLANLGGSIIYASPSVARELGLGPYTIESTPTASLLRVHPTALFDQLWDDVLQGETVRFTAEIDISDEPRFAEVVMNRPPDRSVVLISARDVTEQRDLNHRLQQAQQMEALGRLAGGVAHDFNNLLVVILGSAELAQLSSSQDEATAQELDNIIAAAERGAKLTRQLLTFAQRQVVDARNVDVVQVLRDMEELLFPFVGSHIDLHLELPDDTLTVLCAPVQIEQLVMNLTINGRDAMPRGGTLSIHLASVEHETATSDLAPGTYVELTVEDTGDGIDPETLPRIFEPFFTTKASGVGTGLGLPTCLGIAHQLGGTILVDSTPHQGTRFQVLLPRRPDMPSGDFIRHPTDVSLEDPCILVVDDEPELLAILRRILQPRALELLEASGVDEAIAHVEKRGSDIDVMVCDVMLGPGRSGLEVVEVLQTRAPRVAIVLISGFVSDPDSFPDRLLRRAVFLQKPFAAAQLWDAIERAQQSTLSVES